MPSIPPSAYQVTSPSRIKRLTTTTTQQVSRYKPTSPFRTPAPPPPSTTTQPVSYYKPTSPFKVTPPPVTTSLGRAGRFLAKIPKGGGAALAIALEAFFPPPAGDNYYDRHPKNPPPKYKLHPPEPATFVERPNFPFQGGQTAGVLYNVRVVTYTSAGPNNGETKQVWGPVAGIVDVLGAPDTTGFRSKQIYINAKSEGGGGQYYFVAGSGGTTEELKTFYGVITQITRADGKPDTGGNPPPLNNPTSSAPGNSLGAPSAAPPSAAPSPSPKAPPSTAPAPPPGDAPEPKRHPGPAPSPSPGSTPQPQKYPEPSPTTPDFFPTFEPSPTPGVGTGAPNPAQTPGMPIIKEPTIFNQRVSAPALPIVGNPLTPKNLPARAPFTPNILQPNPLSPSPFTSNPTTGNPEPKAPPLTSPNKSPDPEKTTEENIGDQVKKLIGPLAIGIAAIDALVQPSKIREAAGAANCEAFAPGGCNAPIANNAAAAATNSANNNTLLATILAFLEALQAAFLLPIRAGVELINTKLGPVMAGVNGIGGFLSRTAQAAKLDKVLGAMNTILLLHNAAMLSRNLGSTLGDLTSQALTTIGITDSEGAAIDINEILGKQANSFMSSILGAEVWAGTKTSWNKASSIISSATNIMYTVRSMFDSTREIMEWTAENTGKIGNALKRFRVVGENAYKWLPERVTVQNRFTQRLDRIREGTDSLDDAASSLSGVLGEVQSIQQEYADLQEQKQKFDQNIEAITPKERVDNQPVTDAVTAAKTASKAPTEIENVFRGEGVSIDA